MVLGASTYRMFAEYWPTPASEREIIAPSLNSLHRVVFFRHLTKAPWGDMAEAAVESGDPIEAIRRIKAETGGDIVVWGSLTWAETFLAAGVVDSVRLVVMPIAIGAGRGVYPPGQDQNMLTLHSATVYDQGLVQLVYEIRASIG